MRPKKITMTAFGSYAQTTTVNFDDLSRGLYLITGDTGAGKTTIFDAIVFALYGKASGDRRDPYMMHSDYVDLSVRTEVELIFEEGGQEHTVKRWIPSVKKRAGGYALGSIDAELQEQGKPVIKGASHVTSRIEAMLGLNADQFRKIVMLAQGDFRKFLDAPDLERGEILKRLFDFRVYTEYQNRIQAAAERLEGRRKDAVQERDLVMRSFQMPEGLTPEEQAAYASAHPELVENLEALCSREEAACQELLQARDGLNGQIRELDGRIQEAKTLNDRFAALDRIREQRSALDARAEEESRRKLQQTRAEAAYRRVRPTREEADRCQREVRELEQNLEALSQVLQVREEKNRQAEAARNAAREQGPKAESLGAEILRLTELLPEYQAADQLRTEIRTQQERCQTREAQQKQLSEAREQNTLRLGQIRKELQPLAQAETQAAEADHALQIAREKQEKLSGDKGYLAGLEALLRMERNIFKMSQTVQKYYQDYTMIQKEAEEKYHSFLMNQAGFMAEELQEEIRHTGQGFCPVCGTLFRSQRQMAAVSFATKTQGAATQQDVETARSAAETAYQRVEEQRRKLLARQTTLKEQLANALKIARELFGEKLPADYAQDPLRADAFHQQMEEEFRNAVTAAEIQDEKARKALEQKRKLEAEQEELTAANEKLTVDWNQNQSELQQSTARLASAQATLAEKSEKLKEYPDAAEAQGQILRLQQEKNTIEENIRLAEEAAAGAGKDLAATRAQCAQITEKLPGARKAARRAEEEFLRVLAEEKFADVRDYEEALPPVTGRMSGETWLKQELEHSQQYQQDRRDNARELERLEKETEGRTRVDLTALQSSRKTMEELYAQKDAAYTARYGILSGHQNIRDRIRQIRQQLASTELAYRRLDAMRDLAVGTSSDGGKYSFERYVMGSTFREILDAANLRLATMSGGQYELVHVITGKSSNSQVGLGIEVQDHITGKCRGAGSISGGESFQVSMALALGLSDVVQRHAGGQTMDSMFIDEGFGSLSDHALEQAIDALNTLAGDTRQIGIISHVAKLEEIITNRIEVRRGDGGSTLKVLK